MQNDFLPLVSTLSKVSSAKGEKHIWYNGFLYAEKRENQWRCPKKVCKGSLKTKGSFEEEQVVEESTKHSCCGVTKEELTCRLRVKCMKDRVENEPNESPFIIYTEELAKATSVESHLIYPLYFCIDCF